MKRVLKRGVVFWAVFSLWMLSLTSMVLGVGCGGGGETGGEGRCGDGVLDPDEECDDGGREPLDGCDAQCHREWEGDVAGTLVASPGVDEETGDATKATNGVRGCGQGCGSTDVASLSPDPPEDAYIVISWGGRRVTNGPGVDFVVFENPFDISGGGRVFMDQLVVFLSRDGGTWVPFPHDYTAPDETVYSDDPAHWEGFAGVTPVLFHEEENPVDPFHTEVAGGDAFDLADLPADGGEAEAIRDGGFSYLKLVVASACENPDTGESFVSDPMSNGPDIDGVYGRYLESGER